MTTLKPATGSIKNQIKIVQKNGLSLKDWSV